MSKIKEARVASGYTQKEISEMLEIPKRTLENWEEGLRSPAPWAEKLIIEKLNTLKKEGQN